VEDDLALCAALTFVLEVEGYAVRAYPDAESLLADDESPAPDGFILDYRLPGMDGLALLRALRERSERAPALLITMPTPVVASRAAAAEAILVEKPLRASELLDQLRQSLDRSARL
jgi:FixJ family two-component response regulator